jgi:putative transposase
MLSSTWPPPARSKIPTPSPFPPSSDIELFIVTLFQHRDKGRFLLHGFFVMPDHIHVLITPAIDQSTARCIQFIKGGYSFAARNQSSSDEIWQSGYHEHRIRDEQDFHNQLRYIANNPERKQYEDYPHVHNRYLGRLDPIPQGLKPLSAEPLESQA